MAPRERNFLMADVLRDELAALGYRVVDRPDGSDVEPLPAPTRVAPRDVHSVLEMPPDVPVTVQWIVQEGWPEDVARGIASFRRHAGALEVQHVVVDTTGCDRSVFPDDVEVVSLDRELGWGGDRSIALRRSRGVVVIVADGSIEATGDVVGPLVEALADPTVGIAGPFGISTDDLREFHEDPGPEVDAIEGYLFAVRREALIACGGFDPGFRFYRIADIDLSFRVRDLRLRALVVPVPVERHEHRLWNATPADDREKVSKRNFNRFLGRFRGRADLTRAAR
ncbi:MAG: glycosyltransferase [Actinomycetota bacterium]